jgi:hypothetical protein
MKDSCKLYKCFVWKSCIFWIGGDLEKEKTKNDVNSSVCFREKKEFIWFKAVFLKLKDFVAWK